MMPLRVVAIGLDDVERFIEIAGKRGIQMVMSSIADGARDKWIQLAQQKLHSTRQDYIAGIQNVRRQGNVATIELTGRLAIMVELGMDRFDLHDTLLSGEGIKRAKDGGAYRVIPFRHKTPGAGATGGLPMGQAYGPRGPGSRAAAHTVVEDAGALGRSIHREAKKLDPGGRGLAAGYAPKLRGHHATDIYAGMQVNVQQSAGGRQQRTYSTFRTISSGPGGEPRPGGWIHPGIEPHDLAGEVADYVEEIAPRAFESFAHGIMASEAIGSFARGLK